MTTSYRSELLLPVSRIERSFEQHQQEAMRKMESLLTSSSSIPSSSFKTSTSNHTTSVNNNGQINSSTSRVHVLDDSSNISPCSTGSNGSFWSSRQANHGNMDPFSGVMYDNDLTSRLEDRRAKWDEDLRQMRDEFLQLLPPGSVASSRSSTLNSTSAQGNRLGHFASLSSPLSPRSPASTLNSRPSTSGGGKIDKVTQSRYQQGPDGQLHFQVHFDVSEFSPEDIKVVSNDGKLTVEARSEQKSTTGSTSHEFSRSLDIPRNLDQSRLTCNLTSDGILLLDAPVNCPTYQALPEVSASALPTASPLIFANGNRSASQGFFSHGSLASTGASLSSMSQLDSGCTGSINTIDAERNLHFQVAIGPGYAPDEISVRTQDNRVYIHARHEERNQNKTSFREFSKEYDIPENVDPQSVVARLADGILYIEAPLKADS